MTPSPAHALLRPEATDQGAKVPVGREAKRLRVRHGLISAALALIADKGYEATTIDEIAAQGGVARRTFFRYFASKDEVVLGWLDEQGAWVGERLADSRACAPMTAMRRALTALIAHYEVEPERVALLIRLIFSTPELRARYHDRHAQWQAALSAVLCTALRVPPERTFGVQVLVAVAVTAFLTAAQAWAAQSGPLGALRPWVDAAFDAMAQGAAAPA